MPDVDILINLDETRNDQIVVCIHKPARFTRKPFGDGGPVRPTECLDASMDLISKLNDLFRCSVNVLDERGLESFYPLTYLSMKRLV